MSSRSVRGDNGSGQRTDAGGGCHAAPARRRARCRQDQPPGRALTGATTVPAAHAALATAAGHWTLTAAGLAGGVALALTCIGRRRKGAGLEAGPKSGPKAAPAAGPGAGPGNVTGAPVPGAGATPDHG